MFHEKDKDSDYKPVQINLDEVAPIDEALIEEEVPVKEASTENKEAPKEKPKKEKEKKQKKEKPEKENAKPKKEKKKGGILKTLLMLLLFVLIAGLATAGYSLWRIHTRKNAEPKVIEVTIPEGASSQAIARILKEKGIILYEVEFLLALKKSEYDGMLRYGVFDLSTDMTNEEIIKILATQSGKITEQQFTVPEGFSVEQIAEKAEKEGFFSKEEFLAAVDAAAAGFEYAADLPEKETVFYQLQGFLYPDTYSIGEDTTADELVAMMLQNFCENFDDSKKQRMSEIGKTLLEVVTEASILEKESTLAEEMPRIAGVINNRLNQNMRLQMDSTVVYAMTEGIYGVDRVLYSHLEYESLYNTYRNNGLPPGPICNPSIQAIDSVLNAEEHNYLYFQQDLVKNDGSNLFFETYEEHEAAASTGAKIRDEREKEKQASTAGKEATTESTESTQTKKK